MSVRSEEQVERDVFERERPSEGVLVAKRMAKKAALLHAIDEASDLDDFRAVLRRIVEATR